VFDEPRIFPEEEHQSRSGLSVIERSFLKLPYKYNGTYKILAKVDTVAFWSSLLVARSIMSFMCHK
jgi:hypothetical protein